jgi:hypothetical protein
MIRLVLIPVVCALFTAPALATGGFSCAVDDATMQFEAGSSLGRGMGSPILGLKATATLKGAGIPPDLAKLTLDKNLVHSWMAGDALNLHFYLEREGDKPHAYVELVIITAVTPDEIETKGTYALTVFEAEPAGQSESKTTAAKGEVTCSIE